MKNNRMILTVLVVLISTVLLVACSAANQATPTPEPPTPTVMVEPTATPKLAFPVGKFVNPNDPDGSGFEFNADGTWNAFNRSFVLARGTYKTDGDQYIEQTSNSNCPEPMSFNYSFDGTNLKFSLTDQSQNDTCAERKQAFDGKTYVLSK